MRISSKLLQAHRNTAGSSTHIKDRNILILLLLQHKLHQRLRILPRDQYMLIDKERKSHELLLSYDLLQRNAGCAFFQCVLIR